MKSHSTNILILMVALNIGAIAGYYFMFEHVKAQSKAASSLSSTIDAGQQKNSRLSALRLTIKDTEGKRQQLATFLLSRDAEISFIEQLEVMGKKSGLSIKTNNVTSILGKNNMKTLQVQLETTGGWSNILYFLNQIENLPYDIHVQGASVNKQSVAGKAAGMPWVATFDISVTESI